MLSLSKHLYIVDDLKWSFIDAIMNKRIEESLFWIVEYYKSGYQEETWQLLWVVYSSFYFTNNTYYSKKMHKMYKKWQKNNNLDIIIGIVYKFYKMSKFDFEFFNICRKICKYTPVEGVVDLNMRNKYKLKKNHLFLKLILSLQKQHFRNVWFFIVFNFDKSLQIIKTYFNSVFSFEHTKVHDIKVQLLMYVYKGCMKSEEKKKQFTIRLPKKLKNYVENIVKDSNEEPRNILKNRRLYEVPDAIGCFYLNRNKINMKEIKDKYFYHWEYYANKSDYWKNIFEHWAIEFNEKEEPIFINDDIHDKFYEKYNLEPDEQSLETHNKSIKYIETYDVEMWMKTVINYKN
tara:strand:- start:1514 stop:2551 length:1038 start_codon:yes stop_codon:yes gene_type:complete